MGDQPRILRKTMATACEVVCGWSVTGTVFYDVTITACHRQSVCHLLVADLPHLDQLSWTHIRALDSTTMAVWFSGNTLASINVVVLRQTRLVWVFSLFCLHLATSDSEI